MLIRKDGLLCLVGGFERICRWHIPHLAPERLKRSWGRISTTFCRRFEADPSLSAIENDSSFDGSFSIIRLICLAFATISIRMMSKVIGYRLEVTGQRLFTIFRCKLLIENLLRIVNCKLTIEVSGASA
jgi:hypothetical protein